MNKIFVNNIGDLAEAQRASFYRFLSRGISEELSHFPNPFFARVKIPTKRKKVPCLVYLYSDEIKLKGPAATIESCLKRDISYTIQLYISAEYSYSITDFLGKMESKGLQSATPLLDKKSDRSNDLKKNEKQTRIKQDIFFGEIPLMTEEGTFIINGCERVVISQIIRSPGVYFRKEFALASKKKVYYTATVISNKGLWTKFTLDSFESDRIYIKLNDFKRQSNDVEEKTVKLEKLKSNKDKIFIYDLIK